VSDATTAVPAVWRGPRLPLMQDPNGIDLAQTAALLLPFGIAVAERGAEALALLLTALVAAAVPEAVFALARRRRFGWHPLPTALILAIAVPIGLPHWQLAVATVLGAVLADHVFGGRGFGFLSTAVTALAVLVFSFPGGVVEGGGTAVALATIPGAVLLLALGFISWRVVITAAAIVLGMTAWGGGALPEAAAALTFGLVFLAGDPVGAAATRPGRWAHGVTLGALVVVFGGASPVAVVFASLVASLAAPLWDYLAVSLYAARRRRRVG
jgi:Na+-transporting NADH:ubiquinone oxidoreductase subunit B